MALTELLGAPVFDPAGARAGRVRELALAPQEDRARVAFIVVKTPAGARLFPASGLAEVTARGLRSSAAPSDWPPFAASEGLLLLGRDLLDQQIIDVHGRKVVRVNDAELLVEPADGRLVLKVSTVDVGPRGALRRLLKGVLPSALIRRLVERLPAKTIPWDFVDLIETDPARRVKLRISHERLARLHPAEIADIIEELAPAEREAVLEGLDDEVAAEALEEVNPRLQVSIVSALDSDKAADIVEEMDPDAAADLLADLPPETSEEILEEMEPEEREEVSELLEFAENTAAGRMTTDFVALPASARAGEAVQGLRQFEGDVETVSHIYVLDPQGKLAGMVPLLRLLLAQPGTALAGLITRVVSCPLTASDREVTDLFDKYNLLALPVVDAGGRMVGVITADDVITMLRSKE